MLSRFLVPVCMMYRLTKKKCQLFCLSHAFLYKYKMLNKVGVRLRGDVSEPLDPVFVVVSCFSFFLSPAMHVLGT